MQGNQKVLLTIASGQYAGQQAEATSPYSNNSGAFCSPGLKVIVLVNEGQDGSLVATVYNYDRGIVLWALVGLFLVLLCVAGGRSGTLSALGLAFTFACIFFLYLPMVYSGASPFWTAVLVVVLVTVVGMYLIRRLVCENALLDSRYGRGRACGRLGRQRVRLAGAHLGAERQRIETLAYVGQNSKLDVSGLLFSGILISSLGAVMDISMSVTSHECGASRRQPGALGARALQVGNVRRPRHDGHDDAHAHPRVRRRGGQHAR